MALTVEKQRGPDRSPGYDPAEFSAALAEAERAEQFADECFLIEALGLGSAHLVGISLEGMICQMTAIDHSERIRSLTSIASTTGDPAVGQARPEALTAPAAPSKEAVIAQAVITGRAIGSPGFELDEAWLAWRAGRSFERCYDPAGALRQAATVGAAPDRTPRLRTLTIPALVIHGADDPPVGESGGRRPPQRSQTPSCSSSRGMGYDLPPGGLAAGDRRNRAHRRPGRAWEQRPTIRRLSRATARV